MAERDLINEILVRFSMLGGRLFRNNSGVAEYNGVKVRYGVANPGGSDLIGWKPVTITPDMVGKTLAVFTAVEVKTGKLKATKEQQAFLKAVESAGGIAKIARDPADIEEGLPL